MLGSIVDYDLPVRTRFRSNWIRFFLIHQPFFYYFLFPFCFYSTKKYLQISFDDSCVWLNENSRGGSFSGWMATPAHRRLRPSSFLSFRPSYHCVQTVVTRESCKSWNAVINTSGCYSQSTPLRASISFIFLSSQRFVYLLRLSSSFLLVLSTLIEFTGGGKKSFTGKKKRPGGLDLSLILPSSLKPI